MNTDYKTLREALELILAVSKNRSGDYADCVKELASGSLAALDRIEAVKTVTVEQMTSEINSWAFDDSNPHEKFADHLSYRYPHGLRIVKEKE